MINTVEKAYQDLKRLGLEQEMCNSYILSMIEKKLPEEMRKDWVKSIAEMEEIDSGKSFLLMLEFLKRWRNIIEYDESAIRKAPEKKIGSTNHLRPRKGNSGPSKSKKSDPCWFHEDGNHPIWKCHIYKTMTIEEKKDLIAKKNACQACLEINCNGSKDPAICEKEFRCTVDNCNKPHNNSLHQ